MTTRDTIRSCLSNEEDPVILVTLILVPVSPYLISSFMLDDSREHMNVDRRFRERIFFFSLSLSFISLFFYSTASLRGSKGGSRKGKKGRKERKGRGEERGSKAFVSGSKRINFLPRHSFPHFVHNAGQRECRNCTRHEAHDCITVYGACTARCIASVCAYVLRLASIDIATDDDSGCTVGKNASDAFQRRSSSRRARSVRHFDLSVHPIFRHDELMQMKSSRFPPPPFSAAREKNRFSWPNRSPIPRPILLSRIDADIVRTNFFFYLPFSPFFLPFFFSLYFHKIPSRRVSRTNDFRSMHSRYIDFHSQRRSSFSYAIVQTNSSSFRIIRFQIEVNFES